MLNTIIFFFSENFVLWPSEMCNFQNENRWQFCMVHFWNLNFENIYFFEDTYDFWLFFVYSFKTVPKTACQESRTVDDFMFRYFYIQVEFYKVPLVWLHDSHNMVFSSSKILKTYLITWFTSHVHFYIHFLKSLK